MNTQCIDARTYLNYLTELQRQFPFLELKEFGHTYLGRSIPALQLGEGTHKLLYVGGITCSLFSCELLLRFIKDYAEAVLNDRRISGIDISYVFNTRALTVVPMLNLDGAALRMHGTDEENPLLDKLKMQNGDDFSLWEANGRGVDLRCNYDYEFASQMAKANGIGKPGFPGVHPESEPECAAVARFLRTYSPDLTFLFHDAQQFPQKDETAKKRTFGKIGYALEPGSRRAYTVASILSGYSGYPAESTALFGHAKDWYAKRNRGGAVYEITLEKECKDIPEALVTLRYARLQKMLFGAMIL